MRFIEWLKIDILDLGNKEFFRWKISTAKANVRAWRRSRSRVLSIISAKKGSEYFFPFDPAVTYVYQKPIIHGDPGFVTAELERCCAEGPVRAPAGGIALFRDATVLSKGCILTADGQLIEESLTNTKDLVDFWPLCRRVKTAPLEICFGRQVVMDRHDDAIYVLVKQSYDDNYGHWIIESLPRAGVFLSLFDVAAVKFLVSARKGAIRDVYLSSLGAIGALKENIFEVDDAPHHFDKLAYVLPLTSHERFQTNPKCIEILESIAASVKDHCSRDVNIYVSRNRFGVRKLLNEDEVIAICESFNFKIVYPEHLTFEEQVSVFANAKFIVGNCGAGLANIVFSPRGSTVFALTSEFMHDAFYWDLASAKDITYISLHGKAQGRPKTDDFMERANLDFVIELTTFRMMLADFLASARK